MPLDYRERKQGGKKTMKIRKVWKIEEGDYRRENEGGERT